VVLTLLGDTMGGFEPSFLFRILSLVMDNDSFLLFDANVLADAGDGGISPEEIERTYLTEPHVRFNLAPLTARGAHPEDCRLSLACMPVDTVAGRVYRVRRTIRFIKDTLVQCGAEEVQFSAGDELAAGSIYTYTCGQLRNLIARYGFSERKAYFSRDGGDVLILAAKRPRRNTNDHSDHESHAKHSVRM
jgi:hypothetical protein